LVEEELNVFIIATDRGMMWGRLIGKQDMWGKEKSFLMVSVHLNSQTNTLQGTSKIITQPLDIVEKPSYQRRRIVYGIGELMVRVWTSFPYPTN